MGQCVVDAAANKEIIVRAFDAVGELFAIDGFFRSNRIEGRRFGAGLRKRIPKNCAIVKGLAIGMLSGRGKALLSGAGSAAGFTDNVKRMIRGEGEGIGHNLAVEFAKVIRLAVSVVVGELGQGGKGILYLCHGEELLTRERKKARGDLRIVNIRGVLRRGKIFAKGIIEER